MDSQHVNEVWAHRWHLALDANGDQVFNIADVWAWITWVFFAPGDLMILGLLKFAPSVAAFLQLDPSMASGRVSFWLSLLCYMLWAIGVSGDRRILKT